MKKTLMIMLALVLVIAMSVTGTLAYLTSTDEVTNTFTVGKVEIVLDEKPVDVYGVATSEVRADRVDGNEYKLVPGHEYTKDPIVWVQPESEASWLFVKVVNPLGNMEATTDTIHDQILANGWTVLEAGVYYKEVPANLSTADTAAVEVPYAVFESFTIADDATVADADDLVITAYAVQKDGLTVDEAWDAANA